VDPSLDGVAPPLTQARITIQLRDGRVLTRQANGARGYPAQPATDEELDAKFLGCARRALPEASCETTLDMLRQIRQTKDIRLLTAALSTARRSDNT
jgi:hypothetical protein